MNWNRIGTHVVTAALTAAVTGSVTFGITMASVVTQVRVNTAELVHLKEADSKTEDQVKSLMSLMEKQILLANDLIALIRAQQQIKP